MIENASEGRFPHGKRGLKFNDDALYARVRGGRFPHGKRGLKLYLTSFPQISLASLPPREAWIEIQNVPAPLLTY